MMQRVLRIGRTELWLVTESGIPEIRPYEIAPPVETVRLRRQLLRRIARLIREMLNGEAGESHEL